MNTALRLELGLSVLGHSEFSAVFMDKIMVNSEHAAGFMTLGLISGSAVGSGAPLYCLTL